jgi:hypothetical protein
MIITIAMIMIDIIIVSAIVIAMSHEVSGTAGRNSRRVAEAMRRISVGILITLEGVSRA